MVQKAPKFHQAKSAIEALHPTAATLEAEVSSALAMSGQADASDVEVTADGSTILLSGRLRAVEEIERCIDIAKSVGGVERVVSRLSASYPYQKQ
jgi:osmotically-inducible protein OsmY